MAKMTEIVLHAVVCVMTSIIRQLTPNFHISKLFWILFHQTSLSHFSFGSWQIFERWIPGKFKKIIFQYLKMWHLKWILTKFEFEMNEIVSQGCVYVSTTITRNLGKEFQTPNFHISKLLWILQIFPLKPTIALLFLGRERYLRDEFQPN